MKSREELLRNQEKRKKDKEKKYIDLMENILKNKYKNGLNFDKIPHIERLVCNLDSNEDIHFYTNVEKEFILAIQKTETFKNLSKELIENGYRYEFNHSCKYSTLSGRPDWRINLIIK